MGCRYRITKPRVLLILLITHLLQAAQVPSSSQPCGAKERGVMPAHRVRQQVQETSLGDATTI